MNKQRKFKILVIVALVLAIGGLSLGFAAFSKVLTINAKATVKPKEQELKLNLYGLVKEESYESFLKSKVLDITKLSSTETFPLYIDESEQLSINSNYKATIDSETLSINIDKIELTRPNQLYFFAFVLENVSEMPIWLRLSEISMTQDMKVDNHGIYWPVTCTQKETSKTSSDVCNYIQSMIEMRNIDYSHIEYKEGQHQLLPGEQVYFDFALVYPQTAPLTDEELSLNITPIQIEFSENSFY